MILINKNQLNNWIIEKTNKNNIKFELIFKRTKDGYKCIDFYNKCENKGPTLILIKTTKNKIFGGFTPLNWKKGGREIYDRSNQTFIFSLNLMKKYDIINKEKLAIYCLSNYGPNFGACDLALKENMKKGESYANDSCNFLSNKNLELTGGKGESEQFATEELEVYRVIY